MGKRGPKPTPTRLLKDRGSWRGAKRQKDGEIQAKPIAGEPPMPADLEAPGQAEWKRVVPLLRANGVLTELDVTALGDLCRARDEIAAAQKDIHEHGRLIVSGEYGKVVLNPMFYELKRQRDAYVRLCGRFGLTPADRVGLKAEPPPAPPSAYEQRRTAGAKGKAAGILRLEDFRAG